MLTFSPKKSNRIALCLGPILNHRIDYKKVMPFSRSWKAVLIMMVFFIPMWYAEITVFQETIDAWSKSSNFFMLTIAIFMTCWLTMWSLATFVITVIVVAMMTGRGVLLIYKGLVEIHLGIPWFNFAIREAAADIDDVFLVDPDPKSFFPKQGKQLQISSKNFKEDSKKKKKSDSPLGSNMTEQDVFEVKQAIARNSVIKTNLSDANFSLKQKQTIKETIHETVATSAVPASGSSQNTETNTTGTVWALVLANLLPILGVLALNWNLQEIMVLYWVETAVILFYHLLKNILISPYGGLFSGLMTLCQTGAFMALHLLFIWFSLSALDGNESSFTTSTSEVGEYLASLWFGILALVISHGYSFITHFLPSPQRRAGELLGIDQITSRVVIMHLTIILGMFLALMTGAPIWSLIVLIVLKLVVDINAHKKQHKNKKNSTLDTSSVSD